MMALLSCEDSTPQRFVKLEESVTGVDFINGLSPTVDLNILTYLYYYNGAGVGAGDFNNDGLTDLYFVGNQRQDELYLNSGSFEFKEVAKKVGIDNDDGWSFGVSVVDINNDGLLDIYLTKVGDYLSIEGHNLLYVNQGIADEGLPYFEEKAKDYQLDFKGFSTHAAFFDFDQDGDLDLYLLNHSVHPNRSYGKGAKRLEVDALAGDRLYENHEGVFEDVSELAGILQGSIGYGLGVSIGDITNDGYPDIYVGNDFFESDYLYINQGDGSFDEVNTRNHHALGHTSHFSMGNAMADLNNDGWSDIVSLDMLPEELSTYKVSGHEDTYSIYSQFLKNGYSPQYMQNTLHFNLGQGTFSEVGHYAGIAATEWSWGVLAADFDMDGHKDLHITNGIVGATNDMDFISFIAQDEIQRKISESGALDIESFSSKLPQKKVHNYAFRNLADGTFGNVTENWLGSESSFSSGSVAVDLDNDGDLDLVVNNIDGRAGIYRNTTIERDSVNYIKVKLLGDDKNINGVGARIKLYAGDLFISQENYAGTSYLSSSQTAMTIALGEFKSIDSLVVIWPGGKYQKMVDVDANQQITVMQEEANGDYNYAQNKVDTFLINAKPPFDFVHQEITTLEFDRDGLIPYAKGHEGPGVSVADVNKDGLEDVFICGSRGYASVLLVQSKDGSFQQSQQDLFNLHTIHEDTDNLFVDVDGDDDPDLIVVSGGNEFNKGAPLQPRLYINDDGLFAWDSTNFGNVQLHAAVIKSFDLEGDGDADLVIGANTVAWSFGNASKNYLLRNDGSGHFQDVSESYAQDFHNAGLIEDIAVVDWDQNGLQDLVVLGHWMPIELYLNDGQSLEQAEIGLDNTHGWWNTLEVADFDQDGDLDIVAGNWGLNSRLKASADEPIMLYLNDFDENDKVDPIVTYWYKGVETTLASKDELTKSLPFLNKKFLSYESFAEASVVELFGKDKLEESSRKKAYELANCFFENTERGLVQRKLPMSTQFSSVHDIEAADFNHDGFLDLLLVGNTLEISTQLGRLDASHGILLVNDQKGWFNEPTRTFGISGVARDVEKIDIEDRAYFIIGRNNGALVFLENL
ncbi:MAG: VCBS repeat-containing protein [Cyclobacteriaceae bacterium]